jgi:pimeloyl-ACP methyl ester carboxylesterase
VLVLVGELDWIVSPALAADVAALFPGGRAVVQPGAAHYPWLDDATAFARVIKTALSGPDCAAV